MLGNKEGTAPVFEIAGSKIDLIFEPCLVALITFVSVSNKKVNKNIYFWIRSSKSSQRSYSASIAPDPTACGTSLSLYSCAES